MNKIVLTIATVCFNSRETIGATIASVLRQKVIGAVEYIVIDGGSRDGTFDIICGNLKSIDLFISESDDGIYFAMNKAIDVSTGEYILFLNSDDVLVDGAIEKYLSVMVGEYKESELIYGDYMVVRNDGQKYRQYASHIIKSGYFMCHQAMAIKVSLLKEMGKFDVKYRICSDFKMVISILNRNPKMYKIDSPLAEYSLGGVSSTKVSQAVFESIDIAFRNIKSSWRIMFISRKLLYLLKFKVKSLRCSWL